ncbi:MAG TPA: tetratricopeptide repeat protein, partial [Thermoanaerobaculia bacterium]|nr:tetratricopeptide repeat protein [Thermoanaerobaculia bacterium]
IDPGNARALEQLGLIEMRRGHWEAARQQLERAVAANPRLPVAWNNLGVALSHLNRPGAALAAWRQALGLNPNLWDTLWNLGLGQAEQGQTLEARATLGRFIAQAPPALYGAQVMKARRLLAQLGNGLLRR